MSIIFFVLGAIFYSISILMDPGFTKKLPRFLDTMHKILEQELNLDYLCVYCESMRSERSFHCNFCNRCVEKFDHHCPFINNCLGYRNHKYFLLFIVFFLLYLITVLYHSVFVYGLIHYYQV
mmetsp:Transcript_18296/g.13145  ORF Transcript_18296/g.13145 Transcript_18296/m.13145 type:complete len:122 (-) Transcript_18296:679-1044(-)